MLKSMTFQERFEKLKEADLGKNDLIEELDRERQELRQKLDEALSDLEREKFSGRGLQNRCQRLDTDLRQFNLEKDRNAFVSVLIDGDCMNFTDELLRLGGREASHRLRKFVIDYMDSGVFSGLRQFEVLIRIYVNMEGMVKVCNNGESLNSPTDFTVFAREFNMQHEMCDIIDAGKGKECSDTKLRGIFKLHIDDVHCKHIIFGGSADNSHARLLGSYRGVDSIRERITMLEGPPFARELAELKPYFGTTAFPEVFRDTKIQPQRRVSFSQLPPRSPSANSTSYASTVAASKAPVTNGNTTVHAAESGAPTILRNINGQRVDSTLKPSPSLVALLKPRKLCNQYHLLGPCPYHYCTHEHGDRLKEKELEALRYISRLTACSNGLACDDKYCIAGHKCPQNPCFRQDCRFREMHGVDTKIVNAQGQ